ncbi:MAG: hypothetical protein JWN76_2430 [Chitinophagaceae bacterium]|nr:hypothetical protein [Chitinophagaceae bacterium]
MADFLLSNLATLKTIASSSTDCTLYKLSGSFKVFKSSSLGVLGKTFINTCPAFSSLSDDNSISIWYDSASFAKLLSIVIFQVPHIPAAIAYEFSKIELFKGINRRSPAFYIGSLHYNLIC